MSASPAATPVTIPALDTVAIAVFDEAHAACDVTVCVVPSDIVAVAVNCAVAPVAGAVPVTAMLLTVGEGADELDSREHTAAAALSATIVPSHRHRCRMVFLRDYSSSL
jgi:hypothetical protein